MTFLASKLKNASVRAWLRWHRVQWHGASPALDTPLPKIRIYHNSGIELGSHCAFGGGVKLMAADGGRIHFGNFVTLSDGGSIAATLSVVIGDRTRMAAGAIIMDSNFHPTTPTSVRKTAPVVLGRNVCWHHGSRYCPASPSATTQVVSAGSVVKHDLPPRCIAAGNPAQVVSRFDCPDGWYRT